VATGRLVRILPTAGTNWFFSMAFSPDGKTLASGSLDGAVRLWDVATGRQIGSPLVGNKSGVDLVAFSPDGKTVASADLDGAVRLWGVSYLAEDIVSYLCTSTGRSLTRAEWARYLPAGPAYERLCP
jgi:WD40 repeat protein